MTRPFLRQCLLLAAALYGSVAGAGSALGASACQGEAGLRALASREPLALRLSNTGGRPLRLYWINFEGNRQFYAEVAPGQDHLQPTYIGHPWVVTDSVENCRLLISPGRGDLAVAVGN